MSKEVGSGTGGGVEQGFCNQLTPVGWGLLCVYRGDPGCRAECGR